MTFDRETFRRMVRRHGEDAGDFDNPYSDCSPTKLILEYVKKLEAVLDAAQVVAAGRHIPELPGYTLMLIVDGPERNGLYAALAAMEFK